MTKTDPATPDVTIARGRRLFLGIVLVFVLVESMGLMVRITESDIARVFLAIGLLFAAWIGQQWAIALVALGCPIGALLSFVLGLSSGNAAGAILGILLAILYGGIFLLFLRSESLNTFFKHQATVFASQSSDDPD